MGTEDWQLQRKDHLRLDELSERRRDWIAFMLRLQAQWYESWRISLADQPVSPYYHPLKPYTWPKPF